MTERKGLMLIREGELTELGDQQDIEVETKDGIKDLPVYWFGHMAGYWCAELSNVGVVLNMQVKTQLIQLQVTVASLAVQKFLLEYCWWGSLGDMEIFILLWSVVMGFELCSQSMHVCASECLCPLKICIVKS